METAWALIKYGQKVLSLCQPQGFFFSGNLGIALSVTDGIVGVK